VGVDHGGFDISMAEEFLDGADVPSAVLRVNSAGFEEVGGEAVAKGVGGDVFADFGGQGSLAHGFLDAAFVEVMATDHAGTGVYGKAVGGEDVLPDPFAGGVGVFFGQGVGEVDGAVAGGQVGVVQLFGLLELEAERFDGAGGEHGEAVFFTFAIAHDDLVLAEIDVPSSGLRTSFDAQAQGFEETKAGAVEEEGDELVDAAEAVDDGAGFVFAEDGGEVLGGLGAGGLDGGVEGTVEDFAVEEEEGAESLILGGGGDVLIDGEMGEEGFDLGGAHVGGVLFAMKEDEALDPVDVGLFGAEGVVFEAEFVPHLIQEFYRWCVHLRGVWEVGILDAVVRVAGEGDVDSRSGNSSVNPFFVRMQAIIRRSSVFANPGGVLDRCRIMSFGGWKNGFPPIIVARLAMERIILCDKLVLSIVLGWMK